MTARHLGLRDTGADDGMAVALSARIRERLPTYAGGWEPNQLTILLKRISERPASRLYFFAITPMAVPRAAGRGIVVKVPLERSMPTYAIDKRPRLAPVTATAAKHRLEYRAMSRLQHAIDFAPTAGIFAVRVLDHFPEDRALVLETVRHPTLRAVARSSVRRKTRSTRALVKVYGNVGRLLHTFHSIRPPAEIPTVRARLDDLRDDLGEYLEHLAHHGVTVPVLRRVEKSMEALPEAVLPTELPLAWCHGDPAPRNIFVGPGNEVAAFDVLGARRAPIYEDLAYFLLTLTARRPQVMTQGWSTARMPLRSYERAFLKGYFPGEVPVAELRTYQLLLLLDRWVALRGRQSRIAGRLGDLQDALTDRFFTMAFEESLAQLAALGAPVQPLSVAHRSRV